MQSEGPAVTASKVPVATIAIVMSRHDDPAMWRPMYVVKDMLDGRAAKGEMSNATSPSTHVKMLAAIILPMFGRLSLSRSHWRDGLNRE
jgi:hypothetical protein